MQQLRHRNQYAVGVEELGDGSESPKAWMSVVDADLLESIFYTVARRSTGLPRFLEWGSGLSTLTFTRSIHEADFQFHWVTLEHDRKFLIERVAPYLDLWTSFTVVPRANDSTEPLNISVDEAGVTALVYDCGKLMPFLPEHEEDRTANLDAYVDDPARLARRFDAILVDGRKRRRCLLQARKLIAPHGVVLLHDAFREYYQCAWDAYPAWRRIGEELWIGAATEEPITAALEAIRPGQSSSNS